jgi:hypothetical protein
MFISRPLVALAMALAAMPAAGQSAQRWSLQVSGISVGAQGDAYDGLSNGTGVEMQVRLTPSLWSFGAGFQYSMHTFDDAAIGEQDVTLTGVFFEPRRVFDVGSSSYAPYLSARISVLQQAADFNIQGTTVSASATGTQVNGGGGVLLRLSPRVNLDLGATYGLINFADVEVSIPGFGTQVVEGSSGNGSNLVLRVGLAIGLGK